MATLALHCAGRAGCFPPASTGRADTLAIKQRLSDLLPAADGIIYWTALVGFVQGKLDKSELDLAVERSLVSDELMGLHNALVLSILYNTTRAASVPQTARSHMGWNKRKRGPDGSKVEDQDPKRRRMKDAALNFGKRERGRLKSIILSRNLAKGLSPYMKSERPPSAMSTQLGSKLRISSSSLAQDYARGLQAALCSEAKQLPDSASLKDRMSLVAYEHGVGGGADAAAAGLLLIAVEVHLRSLLGDTLSLIRADRSVDSEVRQDDIADRGPTRTQKLTQAGPGAGHPVEHTLPLPLEAPSMESRSSSGGTSRSIATMPVLARFRNPRVHGFAEPVCTMDVANLSDLAPHSFVQAHPGVIERFFAFEGLQDADDEIDEAQAKQHDSQPANQSPGKQRVPDASPFTGILGPNLQFARPSARSRLSQPDAKRTTEHLLADALPQTGEVNGHMEGAANNDKNKNIHQLRMQMPPVPRFLGYEERNSTGVTEAGDSITLGTVTEPTERTEAGAVNGLHAALGAENTNSSGLRTSLQRNLAEELFPEDEEAAKPGPVAVQRRGRASTDGLGSGSESEDAATITGPGGASQRRKKHGWDRVDTFRLLEGVGNA